MPFIILPCICFRVNLKKKKPTWIVFIELNFTVALLLIRKTWNDRFAGKVGVWGILRNGCMILKREGNCTPLRTMPKKCWSIKNAGTEISVQNIPCFILPIYFLCFVWNAATHLTRDVYWYVHVSGNTLLEFFKVKSFTWHFKGYCGRFSYDWISIFVRF